MERVGFDTKKRIAVFGVLAVVFIILAVSATFFVKPRCESFECFQDKMRKCNEAVYTNDGVEATWKYNILGEDGNACVVEVTLLQVKEGELGLEKLSGYKMECGFPKGIAAYPEKDLDRCHGRLKEEFQAIVIEKLHNYILENLGEIESGLGSVVD